MWQQRARSRTGVAAARRTEFFKHGQRAKRCLGVADCQRVNSRFAQLPNVVYEQLFPKARRGARAAQRMDDRHAPRVAASLRSTTVVVRQTSTTSGLATVL